MATVIPVVGDKAYSSFANMRLVDNKGAIDFKVKATYKGKCEVRNRMYPGYNLNRAEFMARYHKHGNLETTFSMIFGGFVRSKLPVAQVNEVLCKIEALPHPVKP